MAKLKDAGNDNRDFSERRSNLPAVGVTLKSATVAPLDYRAESVSSAQSLALKIAEVYPSWMFNEYVVETYKYLMRVGYTEEEAKRLAPSVSADVEARLLADRSGSLSKAFSERSVGAEAEALRGADAPDKSAASAADDVAAEFARAKRIAPHLPDKPARDYRRNEGIINYIRSPEGFGPWLDAGLLTRPLIRGMPKAYEALANWLRTHKLADVGLDIPTKSQVIDAQIADAELVKQADRISRVARQRAARARAP